jgi:hypothetical protein
MQVSMLADAIDSGWCLRDHQGRFILAGSNVINGKLDIIKRETMAMKEDISEMIQRCLSRVIFESDSQIVIDAILSRSHGVSEFSALITNIKSWLYLVASFEVKFVKRQANIIIHTLTSATNYINPKIAQTMFRTNHIQPKLTTQVVLPTYIQDGDHVDMKVQSVIVPQEINGPTNKDEPITKKKRQQG